jgi:hypothetical protein
MLWALTYFMDDEMWGLLRKSGVYAFGISVVIGLLNYAVSGWLYRFQISETTGKTLSAADTIFLPTAMNMWSYLLPVQGGMFYSVAFFKAKYGISLITGTSLSVITYVINVFIGGMAGIAYVLYTPEKHLVLGLISVLCILSPLLLSITYKFGRLFKYISFGIISKVLDAVYRLLKDSNAMLRQPRLILGSIILNLLHSVTMIAWFYWSSIALGAGVSLLGCVILGLFMKISIILRITPGNLGLEQILAGGLAVVIGSSVKLGVVISLYMTITTIFIVFTVGSLFTLLNISYFGNLGFGGLLQSFYRKKSEL